jgi:hypothetical protein
MAGEDGPVSEFPKAYLRMSPNLDMHPDPAAMVRALCAAARQPQRGRFRDPVVLERILGRKAYKLLVQRGDIVPANPGPGIYLDGWDEWQEGDFTVRERMARLRARKRNAKVTPRVTEPASPDRNDVTTTASSSSSTLVGQASDSSVTPPPPAGRRKDGTNPRAVGTNPRANGTSPRQLREAEKRGGFESLDAILRRANELGTKAS